LREPLLVLLAAACFSAAAVANAANVFLGHMLEIGSMIIMFFLITATVAATVAHWFPHNVLLLKSGSLQGLDTALSCVRL